jgi:hypothetical protein
LAPRSGRKTRPAKTPEGRENQLISLAYDLAERQLRDGTASSQVTTQLLKYGSQRERLEREQIQNQNLLLSAKVDQLSSVQRVEELYTEAMAAFREYKGEVVEDDYEDGYYDDR